MPAGTLLGLQVLNAPDYTMITGLIDQTKINIASTDDGGELDSGGQDEVSLGACDCSSPVFHSYHVRSHTGWQPDWRDLVFLSVWERFVGPSYPLDGVRFFAPLLCQRCRSDIPVPQVHR